MGVLPKLSATLKSNSPNMRCTVVSSIKFTIGADRPIDAMLSKHISSFLLLQDEDLKTRRAALITVNCVAHNKPHIMRELLSSTLPMLYKETIKRPELVHQVDLGPF